MTEEGPRDFTSEEREAWARFIDEFFQAQKPLEPDLQAILSEHWWELLDD